MQCDRIADIARAQERAETAQRDIIRVEGAMNEHISGLRTDMQDGFASIAATVKKAMDAQTTEIVALRLENAKRSGAERLGKWLIGIVIGITSVFTAAVGLNHTNH